MSRAPRNKPPRTVFGIVFALFQSGDWWIGGSSQMNDAELMDAIEREAPPHYGKVIHWHLAEMSPPILEYLSCQWG